MCKSLAGRWWKKNHSVSKEFSSDLVGTKMIVVSISFVCSEIFQKRGPALDFLFTTMKYLRVVIRIPFLLFMQSSYFNWHIWMFFNSKVQFGFWFAAPFNTFADFGYVRHPQQCLYFPIVCLRWLDGHPWNLPARMIFKVCHCNLVCTLQPT